MKMKKFIMKLVLLITMMMVILSLSSCKKTPERIYSIKYRVYWTSNNIKEYSSNSKKPFRYGSSKGSNWVENFGDKGVLVDTSAPIEIISYTYKDIKSEE
jgi:hypothetical protein